MGRGRTRPIALVLFGTDADADAACEGGTCKATNAPLKEDVLFTVD